MENLHRTAMAHYKAGSVLTKMKALSLFRNMDTSGDGRVSLLEFKKYFKKKMKSYDEKMAKIYFDVVDVDGSGDLDFAESLSFYYLMKVGGRFCHMCGNMLLEMHFTCNTCFSTIAPFDLCPSCYHKPNRTHQHIHFSHINSLPSPQQGRSIGPNIHSLSASQQGNSTGLNFSHTNILPTSQPGNSTGLNFSHTNSLPTSQPGNSTGSSNSQQHLTNLQIAGGYVSLVRSLIGVVGDGLNTTNSAVQVSQTMAQSSSSEQLSRTMAQSSSSEQSNDNTFDVFGDLFLGDNCELM